MARGAPRICTYPGCNVLVVKGRCAKHPATTSNAEYRARNQQRRARPDNNDAMYSKAWWRRLRDAKRKADPLCEECRREGRVRAMTHVDHIVPISEGGDPRDWDNLQSLCKPHHTAKTNRERARRARVQIGTQRKIAGS